MLAEREGLTRTILEAFKSPTLYGGKVGTRRSLRPRPQEHGYIFSMGYKIYVERNALRLWIWDPKRQGKAIRLRLARNAPPTTTRTSIGSADCHHEAS